MKKLLLVVALAVVTLAACNKQKENTDSTEGQIVELNERLSLATDTKDSLIFLMSDIYSGIEEINVQEGLLYNLRGGAEDDAQRSEIVANLARIKQELAERQNRLDALAKQFNESNDKNGELAKQVAILKKTIAENESKITHLEEQLKSAHAQIANLQDTVAVTRQMVNDVTAEKQEAEQQVNQVTEQNRQLIDNENRVYYTIKSKKELEKNGIVKKGKILKLDPQYFMAGDKRNLTSIKTYSTKEPKQKNFKTSHPVGSWTAVKNADKTWTINITNPDQFWGASKYLVVEL